jgi:hypothetical protein
MIEISYSQSTCPANKPQQAGTANILNTADPTIVPTPISPSVINVPTQLINNSGLDVAAAIIVQPAMSSLMFSTERKPKKIFQS